MRFFTADQHHSHENIILHCHRPYRNSRHMTTDMVLRHNKVVGENDVTYFLGDFYWGRDPSRVHQLLSNMRGTKILVLGNHDVCKPFEYVEAGFQSVHTSLELKIDQLDVVLAHDPAVHALIGGRVLLHGHLHNLFQRMENCINVGVDVRDFTPISEQEIYAMLRSP